MRPIPFKVARGRREAVKVDHDLLPRFYDALHVHHDYQLSLIVKSSGTLYVANRMLPFRPGDIFMIGKNIPHVFKNHTIDNRKQEEEAISIYFQEDFAGINFSGNQDYQPIHQLLQSANQCIAFQSRTLRLLQLRIPDFLLYRPLKRIISLLDLLLDIANVEDLSIPLDTVPQTELYNDPRIRDVFEYIINHHSTGITLSDVAEIANMTETSFCRYFKQRTRKTYSRYLTEVRVESACTKLRTGKHTISDICYDSGFQNLSNFNRQFKRVTGMSPRQYQKQHLFGSGG